MTVAVPLSQLREAAKTRAEGYLAECLAAGVEENGCLLIDSADVVRIRAKYSGLGDTVAALAQPIARAVDAIAGTKLANCGGCKARQRWLNSIAFRRTKNGNTLTDNA